MRSGSGGRGFASLYWIPVFTGMTEQKETLRPKARWGRSLNGYGLYPLTVVSPARGENTSTTQIGTSITALVPRKDSGVSNPFIKVS